MSKKNRFNYNENQNSQSSEGEETMSSDIIKSTSVEEIKADNSSAQKNAATITGGTATNISATVTPVHTPAPIKTPVVPVKAEPVNTNVEKIKGLIAGYESAVAAEKAAGDGKYLAILEFIKISEFLNKNNDPAVFDYFLRWFQRNQNGIMYHETALAGIHTIQNKNVKTRLSATHACYVELARVRSMRKATFQFSFNAMRLMNISDAQAKWILEKSKTRS